jgi:hypothetical protein
MSFLYHLDDAFLKFVNIYVKDGKFRRPSDIFDEIEIIKNKQASILSERAESKPAEQIYWDENEALNHARGFITIEEAFEKNKRIVFEERLINAPNEFRRFLLEYPIMIYYPKEGGHQVLSSQLFSTCDSYKKILKQKFFDYEGRSLHLREDDLNKALRGFFKIEDIIVVVPEKEYRSKKDFLKQDKNAYCMHLLFGNFKYEEIFDRFPNDESYSEEGEVSEYLKQEYEIVQSFISRTILPTLKSLKNQLS